MSSKSGQPVRQKRGSAPGATRRREPAVMARDEVVRQRIIRAAADIYREYGYERATMIAFARRLDMTAPALYWYFKSKEEILVAFLEHTIADLIQHVRSQVKAKDARERLRQFVEAYVAWQLQQQELSAAYERIYALGQLRNSLPERQRQRVKALERDFYALCRTLVAAARKPGSQGAGAVSFALIGMVEHLIAWFRPNGTLSVRQVAVLYGDLALAMVGGGSRRVGVAGTKR
jgi:AcrR family transcriptional regulator